MDRNEITRSERDELTDLLICIEMNQIEIIGTKPRFHLVPLYIRMEPKRNGMGWDKGMSHLIISKNNFFVLRKY